MEKPAEFYWGRAAAGLVVIAVGLLFLLRNLGVPMPFMALRNWWALFILLGAVPSLGYALQRYRSVGRVDALVVHSLLSAGMVIMVALFFLLELSWVTWWPLFVIAGGMWMLVKGGRRRNDT